MIQNPPNREPAEALIKDVARLLLEIGRREGVTIKRIREIMVHTQLQALDEEGLNRFEIMALSGFSRRAIRLLLAEEPPSDRADLLGRFMGHWAADPRYPDVLPIADQTFPSFAHLHDQYGNDFTAPGLLKVLEKHGLVAVEDGKVRAVARWVIAETQPEMLDEARRAIRALLTTLIHNLAGEKPPHVQRRFHTRMIPPDKIGEVRDKVRALLDGFALQLVALMDSYEVFPPYDAASGENGATAAIPDGTEVGVGVHWYEIADAERLMGDFPGHETSQSSAAEVDQRRGAA